MATDTHTRAIIGEFQTAADDVAKQIDDAIDRIKRSSAEQLAELQRLKQRVAGLTGGAVAISNALRTGEVVNG